MPPVWGSCLLGANHVVVASVGPGSPRQYGLVVCGEGRRTTSVGSLPVGGRRTSVWVSCLRGSNHVVASVGLSPSYHQYGFNVFI